MLIYPILTFILLIQVSIHPFPGPTWNKRELSVPSVAGRIQNNFLPLYFWVPKHHEPDRCLWVQQCITNQSVDSFPWWNEMNNLVQVYSGHLCRYLVLYGSLVYFLHVTAPKILIRIICVKGRTLAQCFKEK